MNNRKFGIEIEAYGVDPRVVVLALRAAGINAEKVGYTHQTTPYWKMTTDASLTGVAHPWELVSPILEGEAGLAEITTVCRVLNELNVKVNTKCGLHVHVDARDATTANLANLLKQWAKHEANFLELLPPSRRANFYCKPIFTGTLEQSWERINSAAEGGRGLTYFVDRYSTLNLEAYGRHRTVEYRLHNGTVNGEKICSWVELVVNFTADAFKGQFIQKRGAGRFEYLLKMVSAKTGRYLTARREAMAARLNETAMNTRAA